MTDLGRMTLTLLISASFLGGGLVGCKKDDDGDTGGNRGQGSSCPVPGYTRDCTCENGQAGKETCLADNTIGPCDCGAGVAGSSGTGGAAAGSGGTSGSGGESGAGGAAGGEPPVKGPCCEAQQSAGCDDPAIEACVCAEGGSGDPRCCSEVWDSICVELAAILNCGCKGDCCEARSTPGCDDPAVESCVCANDPGCCDSQWDEFCVIVAEQRGCTTCGKGSCCEAHATGGCNDAAVEACVCAEGGAGDPSCCNESWDAVCVELVDLLSCGTCG